MLQLHDGGYSHGLPHGTGSGKLCFLYRQMCVSKLQPRYTFGFVCSVHAPANLAPGDRWLHPVGNFLYFFFETQKIFFLALKHRLVYFSHILEHLGRLAKKIRNDFIDFRGLSIRSPRAERSRNRDNDQTSLNLLCNSLQEVSLPRKYDKILPILTPLARGERIDRPLKSMK